MHLRVSTLVNSEVCRALWTVIARRYCPATAKLPIALSALLVGTSLTMSSPTVATTVYENGDVGNTQNWRIAARTSSATGVKNEVNPVDGDRAIVFTGSLNDAFQIGYGSSRWGNFNEKYLSWSMRSQESYIVYVVLYTDRGRRTLRYRTTGKSLLGYKSGYVDHGLGENAIDGLWHTHVRDLQADLAAGDSGNRIVAVNSVLIRGAGTLDDLALHVSLAEASLYTGVVEKVENLPMIPVSEPEPTPTPAPSPAPIPAPSPAPNPVTEPESSPTVVENGKLLAFPGAEGHGRFARGGRGGRVVIVDTLLDRVANDGRTSLREALEVMKGPRTVVFDVGGTFDTGKKTILMVGKDDSNVTVACQSAPSPGVLIRGSGIRIRNGAHNIVMRHCAIRNIDPGLPLSGSSRPITIYGGTTAGNDLIFDHMSLGWATDENFTAFVGPTAKADLRNITLSRSLIAEGDADSTHPESGRLPRRTLHSMGPSCASSSDRYRMVGCSIIGNLIAHNGRRNPLMWGMSGELAKNVIYNWHETALDARPHKPGRLDLHVWDNQFKAGPSEKQGNRPMVLINEPGSTHLRVNGNSYIDSSNRKTALRSASYGSPNLGRNSVSSFRLGCVGASRPARDAWDERVISEYRNGTGQVGIATNHKRVFEPRSDTRHPASRDRDRDGMADAWERAHGLDPNNPNDHRATSTRSGYTAIEAFLNELGDC